MTQSQFAGMVPPAHSSERLPFYSPSPSTPTMADPVPGPEENTMFSEVPTRVWQLHTNPEAMVQEHQRLMDWIDELLDGKTEPFSVEFDGQHHTVHRTAKEGFFKVLMRLPAEFVSPGQQQDVTFVFSLMDLYLLGFLDVSNNKWRFFKDARLEGSGYLDDQHSAEWERLDFEGGYKGDAFAVEVGLNGLTRTHDALTNFSQRVKDDQLAVINKALLRMMFVIPEANRFPGWLERLLHVFAMDRETMIGNFFGSLFRDWSTTSKTVLAGPAAFKPTTRYRTYSDAFAAVNVICSNPKTKQRMVVDEADVEAKDLLLQKMPFLSDYDDFDSKDDGEGGTVEEEEGVTTEEVGRRMPTRRTTRVRSPPMMRMPKAPPRRAQQQMNTKKCCFLFVFFLFLLIVMATFWF